MPKTDILDVYLYGSLAGTLTNLGPFRYRLDYTQEWSQNPSAVPLSLSLPLSQRQHTGQILTNFLDNLLPDAEGVREAWAVKAGLPTTEIFGLLAYFGADVAGAVEFHPAGLPRTDTSSLTPLDDNDIAARIRLIRNDDRDWIDPDGTTGKFSLAGAQGKFALARRGDQWWEPTGRHPATHIFKPQVAGFEDGEIIEYIIMLSARLLGLSAAGVTLEKFGSEHTLVVQRFDRYETGDGVVERIHQEDLCQALGQTRLQKYESKGGAGYGRVLDMLGRIDDRELATESRSRFLQALFYSWLVLNSDAHAKNYSVQLMSGATMLSPLYDVSSLLPYLHPDDDEPGLLAADFDDVTLSMRLVESYRVGDMSSFEWSRAAGHAGVDPARFLQWGRELCAQAPIVIAEVVDSMSAEFTTATAQRLSERIALRCEQALAALYDPKL